MGTRRKNLANTGNQGSAFEGRSISFTEAKVEFLRELRGLAKQTQRWHKENLKAFENVLERQQLVVSDVSTLTASFVKSRYVYYMLEDLGLKANTINGRIRTMKSLSSFLHKEGYIAKDFGLWPMQRNHLLSCLKVGVTVTVRLAK